MKGSGKPKKLPATPKSKGKSLPKGMGGMKGIKQPPTLPPMAPMAPTQGSTGDESIMGNSPGFKKGGPVKGKKKK